MNLKKATLFAIVGILYIFISRTIATFFFPNLTNLAVTQINTLLSLLASFAVLIFYIYFYKDYVQEKQIALKVASLIAIIGSCATSLLFLKGVLKIFNLYIPQWQMLNVLTPFVSTIFSLYFFIIFYKACLPNVSKLKIALLLAIIGFSISTLIRTFILINFFHSGIFRWLWNYSLEFLFVFIPIIAFIFLANLYFFIIFYKEQNNLNLIFQITHPPKISKRSA
ncbi:MAG: hypothetical protein U9P79_01235 [Candidatus Cloacimonadota bacterium]|nr:hypothetical protein [Candidatus Cloacimonadota bacterium]